MKLVARAHQSLMGPVPAGGAAARGAARVLPAALQAFKDPDAPDALELLGQAPDPDAAAALSQSKIAAALGRANRRDAAARARQIQAVLVTPQLRQPPPVQPPTRPSCPGRSR